MTAIDTALGWVGLTRTSQGGDQLADARARLVRAIADRNQAVASATGWQGTAQICIADRDRAEMQRDEYRAYDEAADRALVATAERLGDELATATPAAAIRDVVAAHAVAWSTSTAWRCLCTPAVDRSLVLVDGDPMLRRTALAEHLADELIAAGLTRVPTSSVLRPGDQVGIYAPDGLDAGTTDGVVAISGDHLVIQPYRVEVPF